MRIKLVYIVCLVLAAAAGCAKPPLAEMESAREAVFRAENDANAAAFAAGSLSRARDALKRMESEADSKRYDAAKTHAAEAIAAAEKAINDGKIGAERAKSDAASVVSALKPEIEETGRNINGARYSNLELDYNALNNDLKKAQSGADQAEADEAAGRYQSAIDTARVVRADLAGINQKILNAAPKKK